MLEEIFQECPHVYIKDRGRVKERLDGIVSGTFQQLQVVSDFDSTITKQHENGKKHFSSFKLFEFCPSITESFVEESKALFNKYHPFEYDPEICEEDKRKLMEEWWCLKEKKFCGLRVSKEEIYKVVSELGASLRDGTRELFQGLFQENVPVLVFSAGLGDTVESVLKHDNVYFPNVKIISNFLQYNEEGVITGFTGPVIHVLNKNEFAIKNCEYHDLVKDRNNVLLMGDSVGDARMADGIEHANNILKIGFLYENIEGNLPAYMDSFDIVLVDDQTMNIPRAIINKIRNISNGT